MNELANGRRVVAENQTQGDRMPIIDVYAGADLFPAGNERTLAEELTSASLRAERVTTHAETGWSFNEKTKTD